NNDPQKLASWLSNKTPSNVTKWLKNANNHSLIALSSQREIVGIATINKDGEILLNYLLPDYISKGIGKALLKEMEIFAKKSSQKPSLVPKARESRKSVSAVIPLLP